MQGMELRRAPRVSCDLWVAISGVDAAPVRRRGDISLTGLFIEVDRPVGVAGSLQWLKLWSPDQRFSAEVMGRIIRSITLDDVMDIEPRLGVAFDFMPDSAARFTALQNLVGAILHQQASLSTEEVESRDLPRAAVFLPKISRMRVEANWPVRIGEIVQVVFRSPGTHTRIPFEGQVVAVERTAVPAGPPSYHVDVSLSPAGQRSEAEASGAQTSISDSVDSDLQRAPRQR